jgi:7,8-dihydropterin-6-yl-methyl-4-(beta-D-ribofuranosyl)aminobenzene 5'-phosphate synthase
MRITALVENTTQDNNILPEHGLSLFIETEKHKLLFDMGQTDIFVKNAEKLGIDISEADIAVVSHGHYDHGGGLEKFLEINKKAPVYISRFAFEPHFNAEGKYIGLNTDLAINERLILTGEETVLDDGLVLLSCNDKERPHYLGSFGLGMEQNGDVVPDDFRHEQYLLINEHGKKILISGCSHKGVMDIVSWFEPDVLIGGFHYSKLPLGDTLKESAIYLDKFKTEYFTCHCTGTSQYDFMKIYMKDLNYFHCGDSIVI